MVPMPATRKKAIALLTTAAGLVILFAFLLFSPHSAKNLWPRLFLKGSWNLTRINFEQDLPIRSTFPFYDGLHSELSVRENGQIQWLGSNALFRYRWEGRTLVLRIAEKQARLRVRFERNGGLLLTTEDNVRFRFQPQSR